MLSPTNTSAPCLISTPEPSDDDTIWQSRHWIRENKFRGVSCPTCEKHVQEYRYSISSAQAKALKTMHTKHKTNYVSLHKLRQRMKVDPNSELTKLAHWRLIRQHPRLSGVWAVTDRGADWIAGNLRIPQSVYVYQGELTGQCGHEDYFSQSGNGHACHHGQLLPDGQDPFRQDAPSSDDMFNDKSLLKRRNRIAKAPDNEENLFSSLDYEVKRLPHEVFFGHESIREASDWLDEQLAQKGGFCPSCDRIAAFNRTRITDSHARLLIEMARHHGRTPVHVPSFVVGGEEVGKFGHASESAHRGLLKSLGTRSGWYRLTDAGMAWVLDLSKTPESIWSYNRFARTYKNRTLVKITGVFAKSDNKHSYADLMSV